MAKLQLDYAPQPKQQLLHSTACQQILFGGSAGGSKSHTLRWDLVTFCLLVPGLEAFLFRRTYGELFDNHIRPLLRELPKEAATYKVTQNLFEFANGSKIILAHCSDPLDYLRYMGAEFHILAIDEASLFDPMQLIELRGRVRLGSFAKRVPKNVRPFLPRCLFASNPGGPAHSFLKRTFIDPSPPMTVFHDNTLKNPNDLNHKGWTTMYIPARLADNKYIDPSYSAVFSAMSPARAKALRDGDWDAVEGSALHLLDKDRHCLAPFTSPRHWATYMALDWGTASPFAVLWFAVASEDSKAHLYNGKPVLVPRGTLIQTNEWYGWTGKENEGVRLPSNVVARRILEKEEALNIRRPEVRIADSSMWNRVDAASPAENMMEATSGRLMLTRCRKDRQSNFDEVNCRLAGNPRLNHDGRIEDTPMLYITANCVQTWRTLPSLLLDSQHPEMGPDGRGENHCYDSLSYMCASRPYAVTLKDRQLAEYNEIKRQRQVNMDHYATRQ